MLKHSPLLNEDLHKSILDYLENLGCDRRQVTEGSMPDATLKKLSGILRGNGLQIGGFVGLTHVYLASSLKESGGTICTVDFNKTHRGIENPVLLIDKLINFFDVSANSMLIIGDSHAQMILFEKLNTFFDFVLLDGNHYEKNVLKDIYLADKILKLGGYLILDDIDHWQGPKNLYNNFPLPYEKISLDSRAGLLRKPKTARAIL